MSFINWGHESPEQKQLRKRFEEEQAIFEQRAAAVAAAAAASAGSGKTPKWIDNALSKLNDRYSEVTELVPNIYLFWDEDTEGYFNGISDGGDDMYDGANFMNTNLTQLWEDVVANNKDTSLCIPYTHTQSSEEASSLPDQYTNPPMDGEVRNGANYFGEGSKYFTNMYPGLFIMVADNISVSQFTIGGNLGSDGKGAGAGYIENVVPGWTLFYKTNSDESTDDPSINQLILLPGDSTGITHEYDATAAYDDHAVLGISDRNRIIYAVVSRVPDEDVLSENDAIQIAEKILEIIL